MSRRIRTLVSMVALLVSTMALAAPAAGHAEPVPQQWRGYWADTFHNGIRTPAQIDQLVADAQAINANALVVQVSRWLDCYCNRSAFPRTDGPINPAPFDPLALVIEKAHAVGIEVHAWVNATPFWNGASPPADPSHVFHTHGETATGADRWLNRRVDGAERIGNSRSLDPANPAAVQYVVDGIASIVRNYDVDGINLDYIRYPDHNLEQYQSSWGYSEVSLARFQAATGRTDVPEPTDEQFSDWRRDQMSAMVRKIFLKVFETDPADRLSIDGITYWYGPQTEGGWQATRTFSEVLQDWKSWLAEGIIDTNIAMNYKREHVPEQEQMFEEWNEVLADYQSGRHAVVGPALYLNTLENSLVQARKALQPSPAGNTAAGWNGYSYANPSELVIRDPSQADAERDRLAHALTVEDPTGAEPLFAEPAAVPEMTWKTTPEAGHVQGTLTLRDGTPLDGVGVTMTNLRTGATVRGRVSDGAGWFGYLYAAPGTWLARVDLPRGVIGNPVTLINVRRGELATARFAPFTRLFG